MRRIILIIVLCKSLSAIAQTESVHLQMDKSIVFPEDTIWFRGYIFDENRISGRSTNLYVELYDYAGQLQSRSLFPIAGGESFGQVPMPKTPGLYWIRSYTRNSGFFFASVTVRGNGPQLVTRSFIDPAGAPVITDTAGVVFNSAYTRGGVSVSVVPGEDCQLYGKNFKLLIKNYRDTVAGKDLTLQPGHQLHINIPVKDVKGFLSLLFYADGQLIARQEVRIPRDTIPVILSMENGKCTVSIHDEQPCSYALAVVDTKANSQNPDIRHALLPPGPRVPVNENGLTFSGRLELSKKKNQLAKNINMLVILDGNGRPDQTSVITLDSTRRFSLSGLAFPETAVLYYGLPGNGLHGEKKIADFKILLDPQVFPAYKAPGPGTFRIDTLTISPADLLTKGTHKLQTVIIKGKRMWSERNKAIDKRYVSARFSAATRYNFNLMDTRNYNPRYVSDVFLYLDDEMPKLLTSIDPTGKLGVSFRGNPVTFYLDEQVIDFNGLKSIPITELAYVKVIEGFVAGETLSSDLGTDGTPVAICVYRRKGKDRRNMSWDNMKTIMLNGYDMPANWTTADNSTLLWMPDIHDKNYTFSLPKNALNGACKLILEGADADGSVFHFEHNLK